MSNEKTFDEEIVAAARRSIIKLFTDGTMIAPDYANRLKIPANLVERAYSLIDYDEVMSRLRPHINELVAERIAAALSQELTNDVKKILSHEPTRLRLRLAVMQALESKD